MVISVLKDLDYCQKKLRLKEQLKVLQKMAELLVNSPMWMSLHPLWNVAASTGLWVAIMLNAKD